MKKIFILSTFIVYHFSFVITNAQSTTILPNRLTVPNVSSLGTCDVTAKGSTVFNTTDNKMYYCNGTNWQEMTGGGFTLPYSATLEGSAYVGLLHIINTAHNGYGIVGEVPSGIGLVGLSSSGTGIGVLGRSNSFQSFGVAGFSNYGTGGYFESSDGTAIEIKGKMYINSTLGVGGSQLVVPSNGDNPIWQAPIAFSVKDLGANNFSVSSGTDTKLPYTVEDFDLGNDFSTVNSEFTVPVKGIYHFDAMIMWNAHTNGAGIVAITLKINGNVHSSVRVPAISGKEISDMLSQDILLNANDKVAMYAYQTSGVTQLITQNGFFSKFSGHLVYRQ